MDPITVSRPTSMGITKNFVELGPNCPFVIQAPIILSYKKKKKSTCPECETRKTEVTTILALNTGNLVCQYLQFWQGTP